MSSIQFGCQGCGQRLKVPEGSEGQQVRCPECETVNVIPSAAAAAETSTFAAPPIDQGPSTQDQNPFSAPSAGYEQRPVSAEELSHQSIEFGDVFGQSWERYKLQVGMCALFGIIFIGISLASSFGVQLVQFAAAATESGPLIVITMICTIVLQQVIGAFQQMMGKRFGLNIVRGSTEPLNGIFSFDRVLRVIGFFLLVGVVGALAGGLVVLPALICSALDQEGGGLAATGVGISVLLGIVMVITFFVVMLRFFLTVFFIVDRNASIFEACEQSTLYMRGNKLQAFLVTFVGGLVVGLFTLVTCGIGFVFAYPFMEVVQAMIYSKATGQYRNRQPV